MAVSDCNKAQEFNPKYVKALLRKGTALEAMKQTSEAKTAFADALRSGILMQIVYAQVSK